MTLVREQNGHDDVTFHRPLPHQEDVMRHMGNESPFATKSLPDVTESPPDTKSQPETESQPDIESQAVNDHHDQHQRTHISPFPLPQAQQPSAFNGLPLLDHLLALCIFCAMAVGIVLGNFVPGAGSALQRGQFAGVSVPIALGLLVMMYPILCKVRYESLHELLAQRSLWKQMGFVLVVNWLFAPFLMLGLGWAFLPDKSRLRDGLILVGLGRCIAMVLIWNGLAGGDNDFCAILVAVNSLLQMVLFAPLAVFYIRVIGHEPNHLALSYDIVATSVAVFLGIPLAAAVLTRFLLRAIAGSVWYQRVFLRFLEPWSLVGLLYTIAVLFASQGRQVVHQITSVLRVAAPLFVYFVVIFFTTLWASRRLGFDYPRLVAHSFTAASNNFELAIAVAIATFGPDSDQALASTVGPLIEVPVLVGLVYAVKWIARRRDWK